jgi:hypothetical protein
VKTSAQLGPLERASSSFFFNSELWTRSRAPVILNVETFYNCVRVPRLCAKWLLLGVSDKNMWRTVTTGRMTRTWGERLQLNM